MNDRMTQHRCRPRLFCQRFNLTNIQRLKNLADEQTPEFKANLLKRQIKESKVACLLFDYITIVN